MIIVNVICLNRPQTILPTLCLCKNRLPQKQSIQKHFPINCFDMISIYFDKFSIFVPTLIFSRGYTPEQIYIKSKELGDLIYEGHCALNDLLASS